MAIRNVVLTSQQDAYVTDLIASGRFQNAAEVLRAGLRMLEQKEKTGLENTTHHSDRHQQLSMEGLFRQARFDL